MDSKEVEITEAAFDLILLLDRVEADEQVILTRNGVPVARLSPIKPPLRERVPGDARGLFVVPDVFDDPLPPEIQKYFDGDGED